MGSRVRGEHEADRDRFSGAEDQPWREARRNGNLAMTAGTGPLLTLGAYYAVLALLAVYGVRTAP